jgi:hypothetical protein
MEIVPGRPRMFCIRAPILKFLELNADRITIYKDDPRRLTEWLADNCSHVKPADPNLETAQASELPKHTINTKLSELLMMAHALGAEAAKRGSTPYGWFTAGWEVDSETWSTIFGDNDPAITIAQYANQMLSGPGPNSHLHRAKIALTNDDLTVINLLVPLIANALEKEMSADEKSASAKKYDIAAAINRAIFKETFADPTYALVRPELLSRPCRATGFMSSPRR